MADFKQDLTEGSVSKKLMRFAMPFLAANILQAFYNMADMLIVGIFMGKTGISGVSIGGQICLLIVNLIVGLASGGTVLIAQYAGAKRDDQIKGTIGTMFTIYVVAAVVLTGLVVAFLDPILNLMQTPAESFAEAHEYLLVCALGTIFIFGYNAVSAMLRGMGDSKSPLLFVGVATVTNIVLDILLVGPAGMGAAGAALATIFAQALSLVLSLVYLRRRSFVFDFKLKSFCFEKEKAKKLLKIGLPASIQGTLVSLSFIILTSLANSFGIDSSSAYGIGGKVNSFAILPGLAISSAIAAMAGQNIGAGLFDRAHKTMMKGMQIALGISAAICLLFNLFPNEIARIFSSEQEVIDATASYLRYISVDCVISSIVFSFNGLIMASGYTMMSLLNALITSIALRVPLAFLFASGMGMKLDGIGLASSLAPIGAVLTGWIFLRSGKWKKSSVGGPVLMD